MQRGNVYPVATDPALHFTEALGTNALATLNLRMDEGLAAGRHCRCIIRHLVVVSAQQLAWELVFFSHRGFQLNPLEKNDFLCRYRFSAAAGVVYGGSPYYYYQADNVDLPYADADFEDKTLPAQERGGNLHLMLVNRSPASKEAGVAGAIKITAYMEPTYG